MTSYVYYFIHGDSAVTLKAEIEDHRNVILSQDFLGPEDRLFVLPSKKTEGLFTVPESPSLTYDDPNATRFVLTLNVGNLAPSNAGKYTNTVHENMKSFIRPGEKLLVIHSRTRDTSLEVLA